jgi:ribosomal protein S18 acetylase RimI-like enzyme
MAEPAITNLLAFFRFLSRSPAVEYWESTPLSRWHTRLGHPWYDGVISRGPAPAAAPELIQATIDYFVSRAVGVFSWWLDPEQSALGWDAALRAAGFGHEASAPGMAVELGAVDYAAPVPAGLEIHTVETSAALRTWVSTFMNGYGIPLAVEPDFHDLIASLGLDLPLRHYLGLVDGQPVATSSLFLGAGVAGVGFVATLPTARGRGLGGALTRAPLRDGLALGYRTGVLQSTEMGVRVYERLGFRKVCDVENYYWKSLYS